MPVARGQGFRGGFTLTDCNASKILAVTLWQSESDLIAGETDGYLQEQVGRIADLMANSPVREHHEVSLQVW